MKLAAMLIAAAITTTTANAGEQQTISGRVDAIIDGDTFIMEGQHIRIWGIDAPEMRTPLGSPSKEALSDLIMGESLHCTRKGVSYNRVVAQCWIGNSDIAAEMVAGGFAKDYPYYSRGKYGK